VDASEVQRETADPGRGSRSLNACSETLPTSVLYRPVSLNTQRCWPRWLPSVAGVIAMWPSQAKGRPPAASPTYTSIHFGMMTPDEFPSFRMAVRIVVPCRLASVTYPCFT
jgi:hypothetical protein